MIAPLPATPVPPSLFVLQLFLSAQGRPSAGQRPHSSSTPPHCTQPIFAQGQFCAGLRLTQQPSALPYVPETAGWLAALPSGRFPVHAAPPPPPLPPHPVAAAAACVMFMRPRPKCAATTLNPSPDSRSSVKKRSCRRNTKCTPYVAHYIVHTVCSTYRSGRCMATCVTSMRHLTPPPLISSSGAAPCIACTAKGRKGADALPYTCTDIPQICASA